MTSPCWPGQAPFISRNFVRLSTLFLFLFVVGALSSGRIELASQGWRTPAALLLFAALAMWSGVGVGALFRLTPDDRFTVAIEVQVRNGSLALVLKAILLPAEAGVADPLGDGVLYVVLFYAGASLVLGVYEATMKRFKWGPLYAERRPEDKPA
jgi:BASS family bile acid:Na+ symporter